MTPNVDELLLAKDYMKEYLTAGILGMIGGIANYIYTTYKKDQTFKIYGFLVNALLAFFLGNVIGSFIPANFVYRDGVLLLAGFSTFPILAILETYIPLLAKKIVNNKIDKID